MRDASSRLSPPAVARMRLRHCRALGLLEQRSAGCVRGLPDRSCAPAGPAARARRGSGSTSGGPRGRKDRAAKSSVLNRNRPGILTPNGSLAQSKESRRCPMVSVSPAAPRAESNPGPRRAPAAGRTSPRLPEPWGRLADPRLGSSSPRDVPPGPRHRPPKAFEVSSRGPRPASRTRRTGRRVVPRLRQADPTEIPPHVPSETLESDLMLARFRSENSSTRSARTTLRLRPRTRGSATVGPGGRSTPNAWSGPGDALNCESNAAPLASRRKIGVSSRSKSARAWSSPRRRPHARKPRRRGKERLPVGVR